MDSNSQALADTVVSRAIIVGVGRAGLEVVQAVRRRLEERVAPNLPMIRYLIVAEQAALDSAGIKEDKYLACLPVQWHAADVDPVRQLADVAPWLPDVDAGKLGEPHCRAAARLCLIKHYSDIWSTVKRLLLDIATPVGEHIEERRQPSTFFYLIASLADPLAGGLTVDLAYLLGQAIRPVQDENVPGMEGDVPRFVNGVLLLPGFHQGGAADVQTRLVDAAGEPIQTQEQERLAQQWEQAHAYAALLELDHYMSRRHEYRCEFRRQDGPFIVPAAYRPFWEGQCFLLGPEIERGQRQYRIGWLTDVGVAVAESLYHRLASPAAGFLEPHRAERSYEGRVGAYSSFGVSAEVLPWRDLREYCVRRLGLQIAEALLRSEAPADPTEAEGFLKRVQITPDNLARSLADDSQWEDRLKREGRPRPRVESLPWHVAREVEAVLLRDDHQWRRDLAEVDVKLLANSEQALEEVSGRVLGEVQRLLDYAPAGSLHRAETLAKQARGSVMQEHGRQSQQLEIFKRRLPPATARVNLARGRYFTATGTFGRFFLAPILALVALFLLFTATDIIVAQRLGQPTVARGVILLSLGLYGFVYVGLVIWSKNARARLAAVYAERQKSEREILEQERLVELYARIVQTFAGLVTQLSNFRQELKKARDRCAKDFSDPALHYRLYQKPSFVLERSVLTPAIVERFYQEITQLGPDTMAAELANREFGPYSRWIFAGHRESELLTDLERYARRRVEPLRRRGVLELLNRLGEGELRLRMETLRDLAQPMWDLDRVQPEPELQRVTAVEPGGQDSRPLALLNQLCPENHISLDRSNPHYLTHTSIRWGAPLYAVHSVRRCRDAYDALVRRGHLAELHTTREHQALADLLPWETEDPRTIFALGRVFDLIRRDAAGPDYYFLYQTIRDLERSQAAGKPLPDRVARVGRTQEEACRILTITKDWYRMVATRVDEVIAENIERLSGNPIVLAYELYQYSQAEADLTAWEKEVLQTFCDRLHTGRPALAPASGTPAGKLTGPRQLLPRPTAPAVSAATLAADTTPPAGGNP